MAYNITIQRYTITMARHFHEYGFAMIPILHEPHLVVLALLGFGVLLVGTFILVRIEE